MKPQLHSLDNFLQRMVAVLQGRVSFGTAGDGVRGENMEGMFQQFTSHASANTEFTVAHGLGAIPTGRLIFWQDKAGSLYQGPSTGTAWDTTNAYFKSDISSVTFLVFFTK